MAWVYLFAAVVCEVVGTASLSLASRARRGWYLVVAGAYLLAMFLFTHALEHGMGLGIGYGVWAAAGVALTAVVSKVLFKERLSFFTSAGIAVVMGGVLLIGLGQ